MTRLAIVASHPVQYYAPLFRELARRVDLTVFYGHRDTREDQARAGFGEGFAWDVDLTSGYDHVFLENRSRDPGLHHFSGIDTPTIGRILRDGRFDAVLILGWFLKGFIQALVGAKRGGIPVLLRGDSQLQSPRSAWKRRAKAAVYPLFLRLYDAALVVGERNAQYWARYAYPAHRTFKAPHCVDNDWFAARATISARAQLRARLGIGPDARVALFAGKLVDFKRPFDLLEAAAIANHGGRHTTVLIAGSGPLEPALRSAARSLGVSVHFLGFCNQSAMPSVYAASDVLVLPSDGRETWGLVINEALACGLPVIVSDAAGCAPDLVSHMGDEWSYPCGNTEALADRLANPRPRPADLARFTSAFSLCAAADGVMAAIAATTPRNPASRTKGRKECHR